MLDFIFGVLFAVSCLGFAITSSADNQTVIENGQALASGLRTGAGVINPKIVESINQVGLPNVLSEKEIKDVLKNSR